MFDFFGNKNRRKYKDHIKNLIALARVDGIVSEPERDYIFKVGLKAGFKEEEIDEILHEAPNLEFKIPVNDGERFDQIFELVQLMLTDGVIEDNEMDFCIEMAEKLGFRKAIVGILVRKISIGINSGLNRDAIKKEVMALMAA
ncbi:MAG: TerB family tellurite resistance protein [Cytophagaceae bacterium]